MSAEGWDKTYAAQQDIFMGYRVEDIAAMYAYISMHGGMPSSIGIDAYRAGFRDGYNAATAEMDMMSASLIRKARAEAGL